MTKDLKEFSEEELFQEIRRRKEEKEKEEYKEYVDNDTIIIENKETLDEINEIVYNDKQIRALATARAKEKIEKLTKIVYIDNEDWKKIYNMFYQFAISYRVTITIDDIIEYVENNTTGMIYDNQNNKYRINWKKIMEDI